MRTSGLLSNSFTFRTIRKIFASVGITLATRAVQSVVGLNGTCAGEPDDSSEDSPGPENKHFMTLDDFVLLLSAVAEGTFPVDPGTFSETAEGRNLKLLRDHIFPAVLQVSKNLLQLICCDKSTATHHETTGVTCLLICLE